MLQYLPCRRGFQLLVSARQMITLPSFLDWRTSLVWDAKPCFWARRIHRKGVAAAIDRAWQSAENVRLPLQEAARRQIAQSQGAYERVKENINSSEKTVPGN